MTSILRYFIFIFLILSCTERENEKSVIDLDVDFSDYQEQELKSRNLKSNGLEKVSEINLSEEFNLFQPYLLNTFKNNNLVFFDPSPDQLNFVTLDSAFTLTKKFGGYGKGPGQYLNVLSLTVDDDNSSIIALDDRNSKLDTWSFEGELKNTESIKNSNIYRVIAHRSSFIAHNSRDPENFIYIQSNNPSEKKVIAKAKIDVEHPVERFFVLSGNIAAESSTNSIYYAGWGNSLIQSYDMEGGLKYSVNSIEPIDYFIPQRNDKGGFNRDPNRRSASRDLEIFGNYLTVLFTGKTKDADQILDFYDKVTGKYSFSFRLDDKSTEITNLTSDGTFYALSLKDNDWYVVKYKVSF